METIYHPNLMVVDQIVQETPDIKTFRLQFQDRAAKEAFFHRPGQFGLYSVFGAGEATFCIANSPTRNGYIECSIKRVGKVTNAFHELSEGAVVGFRGPYGNSFPLSEMRDKDLIFAGGGIGLAPLRSLIWYCLDNRDDFGKITIAYGARTPADLVYKRELQAWKATPGIATHLAVDPGCDDPTWDGAVCFLPTLLEQVELSPENSVVITCGPPIMIKYVLKTLSQLGFSPEQIYTTLEMKMKCGLGKCGRCNIGEHYVCQDGPVFSAAEMKGMPEEY